ncbi:hypothetical protein ACWOAH_00905 [Vagococcus vulneris]|uniref:Uncharacterized protein n=1 Tax=Vagococcus vulneris TaxID=1977869 RepID=A0A430A273_9ENTE|nr:hypothetical protein [Vagococcus vulneris]RSU00554.1 hypothetical protein CBF37_00635 [Vagococcus vulneris]
MGQGTKQRVNRNENASKRNKIIIVVLIAFLLAIGINNLFDKTLRPIIRKQQISSVVNLKLKNKKIKAINASQFTKLKSDKSNYLLIIIDNRDNTATNELLKFINQPENFKEVKDPVYLYQPIYQIRTVVADYQLTSKNNLIYFDNGKEKQRIAFDNFGKNGEDINKLQGQIYELVNPVIPQHKPVRVKKDKELDFNVNPNVKKQTKEIYFDN